MKAAIIRIGNSRGIRLPKSVIEQCGFSEEVEIEVHNRELMVRSSTPRHGWLEAFLRMHECGDDGILDHVESETKWDEEEWEW